MSLKFPRVCASQYARQALCVAALLLSTAIAVSAAPHSALRPIHAAVAVPAAGVANAQPDPLYVIPGETRLDGLVADKLDSTSGGFDLRVCSYTAGHAGRVWLDSARTKNIVVDSKTQLYAFGSPSTQISINDSAIHPYHVTAIGDDNGDGKSLLARIVWVEKSRPAEATFVESSRNAAATPSSVHPEISVTQAIVYTEGHNFPVNLVTVKLNTVRVKVGLAWSHVGATESLGGIVHDYDALAAINGSFFDAYSSNPVKLPDNELICMSEPVIRGDIGTLLGFTPDGEARMAPSPIADALHRLDPAYPDQWGSGNPDQTLFWQRVTEGLGAGPRLLRDGVVSLDPYGEGFRSAEVLDGSALRSAVGITTSGYLMMVATKATIHQLADIMRALGCAQAMNLDGGSSSGLWVQGKYLRRPGRQLSNALLIVHR